MSSFSPLEIRNLATVRFYKGWPEILTTDAATVHCSGNRDRRWKFPRAHFDMFLKCVQFLWSFPITFECSTLVLIKQWPIQSKPVFTHSILHNSFRLLPLLKNKKGKKWYIFSRSYSTLQWWRVLLAPCRNVSLSSWTILLHQSGFPPALHPIIAGQRWHLR